MARALAAARFQVYMCSSLALLFLQKTIPEEERAPETVRIRKKDSQARLCRIILVA